MASSSIANRRATLAGKTACDKDRVVVIDPQKLRQAGLVHLLEDWANRNGFVVVAISSPEQLDLTSSCVMVMLNVGGASVLEHGPQLWIKIARNVLAHVPLVILSDREDRNEVRAAFKEGASGFIASNLDPHVALGALTFLCHGGSFFPLSAIHEETQPPPAEILEPAYAPSLNPIADHAGRARVRVSARLTGWQVVQGQPGSQVEAPTARSNFPLTPRQLEVLNRLREGKPNKLIARDLNMTEATVKVHVRQIMRKLGATNRTQAVLCATRIAITGSREGSS
jgi:DNA-binding NarL/FixJ family response regulator